MKNVTIKQLVDRRGDMSAKLIRATVEQFGGIDALNQCAADVSNHGINGGFHGFIYYSDTCAFYAKHQKDIVSFAKSFADDIGEMVQSFDCIKGEYSVDEIGETLFASKRKHDTKIANCMTWFIGEEIARAVYDIRKGFHLITHLSVRIHLPFFYFFYVGNY